MYNLTITSLKRAIKSFSMMLLLLLFFHSLHANEAAIDLNFFYVVGEVTSATEPNLTCSAATPDEVVLVMINADSVVLNNNNFDLDGVPDCDYGFAVPPNDSTFDSSLSFDDLGTFDAYFYVMGPTANSTPMGPCPFQLTVTDVPSPTSNVELTDVRIYPNPLQIGLNIDYGNYRFLRLELYDSNSMMVRQSTEQIKMIDTRDLYNGVYFLKLYFVEGIVQQKILKQ